MFQRTSEQQQAGIFRSSMKHILSCVILSNEDNMTVDLRCVSRCFYEVSTVSNIESTAGSRRLLMFQLATAGSSTNGMLIACSYLDTGFSICSDAQNKLRR